MLDGVRRARARETSWRWPWERLDPLGEEGRLALLNGVA